MRRLLEIRKELKTKFFQSGSLEFNYNCVDKKLESVWRVIAVIVGDKLLNCFPGKMGGRLSTSSSYVEHCVLHSCSSVL